MEDAALGRRPDVARHRRPRWVSLRQLVERWTGDPRHRRRAQRRLAFQPEVRVTVQVRPQRAVQAGRDRGRPGVHSWHAHGVAAQELRLHRGRGLHDAGHRQTVGEGSLARVRPPAGVGCQRHLPPQIGRILRTGIRRRAQRLGCRRYAVHGRVQRGVPRVRYLG